MPALAVGHAHVTELHHKLRKTPVMPNQAVDTLSRIYNAAGDRGHIPEAINPCRLVAMNRQRARERFLTDAEFRRLGQVLDEAGCRTGEILNLRGSEVVLEAHELRLPDTRPGSHA